MRKYAYNDSFFKNHNTEMFYFLGFFLADGCVIKRSENSYIIQFGLHIKDEHIVKSFQKIINSNRPLVYFDNFVSLSLNSKEMAEDLRKYGIEERKSLTSKWPPFIPEEYLSHFVRGFFDGDGSIFKIKHPAGKRDYIGINFTGTKEFLLELQKQINKIVGKDYGYLRTLPVKSGFYYQLVYSGDATIKKFIDWIYENSHEDNRLKRKYDLSQDYFNNLSEIKPQRINYNKSSKDVETLRFEIDGIEMSLTDMQNDERCVLSRGALYHRIKNLNLNPKEAMTLSKDELPKAEAPNIINKKLANNSKIDWEIAKQIREMKLNNNSTAKEIANYFDLSTALVFDVLNNRSWYDPDYTPSKFDNTAKVYEHNGVSGTLTDWAKISGVPKNTIDRRLREGKTFEQAIQPGRMKSVSNNV